MLIDGLLQMSNQKAEVYVGIVYRQIGMKRWRHLSNSASGEIRNGGLLFSVDLKLEK
jgi:hypothetical protein